jgi:anaerobic selenocysteine-containing dehydrogenase
MENTIDNRVVKSTCINCQFGCGVLVRIEGGRVVKVEGDPDNYLNKGKLCPKGEAVLEFLYHPERLRHPLKRTGARGEGKWAEISWNEALDLVADELGKMRERHGAESVAFIGGSLKGMLGDYLTRFANVFGSPNRAGFQANCMMPRTYASEITYGFYAVPDLENHPKCIIAWGVNLSVTLFSTYEKVKKALDNGAKLIVINPRKIDLTKKADLWLQVRPGSDLALALGMINVIINEELYDRDFVEHWTVGFDKLKEHVQDYTPEQVATITWLSADKIREAARLYSTNKPAGIQWGNAVEHNVNCFQACRALCILRGITGNLSVPGGEAQWVVPARFHKRVSADVHLADAMSTEQRNKKLDNSDRFLPQARGRIIPQTLIKAILKEDPYPIRALYVAGANPITSLSNANETYRALKKLDFLVVAERFMTPTAALADVVFPVATFLEENGVISPPYSSHLIEIYQKATEISDCRPDYAIFRDLAKRLGHGDSFWKEDAHCVDSLLKLVGVSFDELKKINPMPCARAYRDYITNGFKTTSGKVELYSSFLEDNGLEPLPVYHEPPETPFSNPDLADEYPLIFTSGKELEYLHSQGRQVASLRGIHPEPLVHIHPETAGKLGIAEGDWVYIETKRGKIKQKARINNDYDPRVIGIDYAWWFPEKGVSGLYGWSESNINVLTDNKPPYGRDMGTATMRGILCKVYKA